MHRKIKINRYDLKFKLYEKNTKENIVLGEDEKQSLIKYTADVVIKMMQDAEVLL